MGDKIINGNLNVIGTISNNGKEIGGKVTAADVDSGQVAANLVLVSDGHGGASWQQVPGIGKINSALDDINGEVI